MRLVGNRNAKLGFHFQRCAIKILGLRIAPRIRSRMAIDKQRIVFETFFDLTLQRVQMFLNRPAWSELITENLRYPGETLFLQSLAKQVSVRKKEQRRFQCLVAFLMPLRDVWRKAVREVNAPKMSNQQKFQKSSRLSNRFQCSENRAVCDVG